MRSSLCRPEGRHLTNIPRMEHAQAEDTRLVYLLPHGLGKRLINSERCVVSPRKEHLQVLISDSDMSMSTHVWGFDVAER